MQLMFHRGEILRDPKSSHASVASDYVIIISVVYFVNFPQYFVNAPQQQYCSKSASIISLPFFFFSKSNHKTTTKNPNKLIVSNQSYLGLSIYKVFLIT